MSIKAKEKRAIKAMEDACAYHKKGKYEEAIGYYYIAEEIIDDIYETEEDYEMKDRHFLSMQKIMIEAIESYKITIKNAKWD